MVLAGPAKSGKTHLAHVWAEQTEAPVVQATNVTTESAQVLAKHDYIVVEDVPLIAGNAAQETTLFHLHNHLLAEGATVLFTGTDTPTNWALTLPDLASRMQGTPLAQLLPPDDQLLAMVLAKQFADRQLSPSPVVMSYLVTHMERSFQQATDIVGEMDRIALRDHKPLTRAVAAAALDKLASSRA